MQYYNISNAKVNKILAHRIRYITRRMYYQWLSQFAKDFPRIVVISIFLMFPIGFGSKDIVSQCTYMHT